MGKASRNQRRAAVVPMARAGVFVGYCSPGQVSALFCDSLTNLLLFDHRNHGRILRWGGVVSEVSGPRIANARTELVDAFLDHPGEPKVEWFWMLDSDMVFAPDTLERLLEVADPETVPIVGGLCFAGNHGGRVYPTLYVRTGNGLEMDRVDDYPPDSLVKVDATGAACLLIHRSVFEAMAEVYPRPYPWFAETATESVQFGEDITFGLRAGSLGFPTHVHTGIEVLHHKTTLVGIEAHEAYKAKVAAGSYEHPLARVGAQVR